MAPREGDRRGAWRGRGRSVFLDGLGGGSRICLRGYGWWSVVLWRCRGGRVSGGWFGWWWWKMGAVR